MRTNTSNALNMAISDLLKAISDEFRSGRCNLSNEQTLALFDGLYSMINGDNGKDSSDTAKRIEYTEEVVQEMMKKFNQLDRRVDALDKGKSRVVSPTIVRLFPDSKKL